MIFVSTEPILGIPYKGTGWIQSIFLSSLEPLDSKRAVLCDEHCQFIEQTCYEKSLETLKKIPYYVFIIKQSFYFSITYELRILNQIFFLEGKFFYLLQYMKKILIFNSLGNLFLFKTPIHINKERFFFQHILLFFLFCWDTPMVLFPLDWCQFRERIIPPYFQFQKRSYCFLVFTSIKSQLSPISSSSVTPSDYRNIRGILLLPQVQYSSLKGR